MSDAMQVLSWRKQKNGKIKPVQLGWATHDEKSGGMNVFLEALPFRAAEDGVIRLSIRPRRDRDDDR